MSVANSLREEPASSPTELWPGSSVGFSFPTAEKRKPPPNWKVAQNSRGLVVEKELVAHHSLARSGPAADTAYILRAHYVVDDGKLVPAVKMSQFG